MDPSTGVEKKGTVVGQSPLFGQALVFLRSAIFTMLWDKFPIRTIFQLHHALLSDDSLGEIGSELEVPRPVLENLRGTLVKKPERGRAIRSLGWTPRYYFPIIETRTNSWGAGSLPRNGRDPDY